MISAIETIELPPKGMSVAVREPASLDYLLQKVSEGDRAALKTLYDQISSRLLAVLVRMVRRREVAEDLLQDVFVTVWRKAHQFDVTRGTAEAWLFCVTRRKAIDRLRISYREVIGLNSDVAVQEGFPGLYAVHTDAEMHLTLKRCLGRLKPEVRRALELCYQFGFTHEELAIELNVPLGTVKSWVRRGLAQMKETLSGYDN